MARGVRAMARAVGKNIDDVAEVTTKALPINMLSPGARSDALDSLADGFSLNPYAKSGKMPDNFTPIKKQSAEELSQIADDYNKLGEKAAKWAGKGDFYKLSEKQQTQVISKYNNHIKTTAAQEPEIRAQKQLERFQQGGPVYDRVYRGEDGKLHLKEAKTPEVVDNSGQTGHEKRVTKEQWERRQKNKLEAEERIKRKKQEKDRMLDLKYDATVERTRNRNEQLLVEANDFMYQSKVDPAEHAKKEKYYEEFGKKLDAYDKAQETISKQNRNFVVKKLDNISTKTKDVVHNFGETVSGTKRQNRADFATTYNKMLFDAGRSDYIDIKQAAKLQRKYNGMTPEEVFEAKQKGRFGGLKEKAAEVMDKAGEIASETNFMEYLGQGWDWATQDTQHALMVAGGAVGVGILGAEILDDDDDY